VLEHVKESVEWVRKKWNFQVDVGKEPSRLHLCQPCVKHGWSCQEVLSVPHVFRAESVGTARIPIRFRSEILEHRTTQIVGNLSNLSDRIPIGKVSSDRTTRNRVRPISDQFPTGSDRKNSQNSDKSLILIDHLT